MDEEQRAALIAQKLAAAKQAPVKKAAVKKARVTKPDIPAGRAVGGTVGLAATCKTSGCKQQGEADVPRAEPRERRATARRCAVPRVREADEVRFG